MNENEFLDWLGLTKYHGNLQEDIAAKIQSIKDECIGYTDDTTYEPLEEVT